LPIAGEFVNQASIYIFFHRIFHYIHDVPKNASLCALQQNHRACLSLHLLTCAMFTHASGRWYRSNTSEFSYENCHS